MPRAAWSCATPASPRGEDLARATRWDAVPWRQFASVSSSRSSRWPAGRARASQRPIDHLAPCYSRSASQCRTANGSQKQQSSTVAFLFCISRCFHLGQKRLVAGLFNDKSSADGKSLSMREVDRDTVEADAVERAVAELNGLEDRTLGEEGGRLRRGGGGDVRSPVALTPARHTRRKRNLTFVCASEFSTPLALRTHTRTMRRTRTDAACCPAPQMHALATSRQERPPQHQVCNFPHSRHPFKTTCLSTATPCLGVGGRGRGRWCRRLLRLSGVCHGVAKRLFTGLRKRITGCIVCPGSVSGFPPRMRGPQRV